MAINVKGSSEFKIKIDAGGETYGGCAADISGNWNASAQVQVDPNSCSGADNAVYKVFFGDTSGQLKISNLILTDLTSGTSGILEIDLGSPETIIITETIGTQDYTIKLTDCAFLIGENTTTEEIAENVYFVNEVVYQIEHSNASSG